MKLALVLVGVVALPSVAFADDWDLHRGFTFEVAGGAGEFVAYNGSSYDSGFAHGDPTPLALHLGAGGFVCPRLAVTGQLVTNTFLLDNESFNGTYTAALIGPGVQLWLLPELWVGGGIGLMHLSGGMSTGAEEGFGFDMRAGITLPTKTKNAFSVQLEVLPAFLDSTWTGYSALVGYQYL